MEPISVRLPACIDTIHLSVGVILKSFHDTHRRYFNVLLLYVERQRLDGDSVLRRRPCYRLL